MSEELGKAKEYDVAILGGGPAGCHAAFELASAGRRVLLIEKNEIGGVCLHKGCIPTKSLLYSARAYALAGKKGPFDLEGAIEKEQKDIKRLLGGLRGRLAQSNVDCVHGEAKIEGRVGGRFAVSVGGERYGANDLVIAVGGRQREIPIPGLRHDGQEPYVFYSDAFFSLRRFEERAAVIGGGAVGIELAAFLNQIGSRVTVYEKKEALLEGMLDADVGGIVRDSLMKRGIDIVLGCDIQEVRDHSILYQKDGAWEESEAGQVFVAGGRVGNAEGIGLSKLGVDGSGPKLVTDESGRTGIPHVYACGDVTGAPMLAHAAYREAEAVAADILGKRQEAQAAVPSVVYSNPEIAAVGALEEECLRLGKKVTAKSLPMVYSSRYFIENEAEKENGACKLIFDGDQTLIGAQLVGNGASELIFPVSEMVRQKKTAEEIKHMIFPHPSIAEIVKETVLWGK